MTRPSASRPRVIAHRGSSARHADNSWPAFKAALDEKADAIECDVQVTRDGELVIRHDLEVGGRMIADISFAELRKTEPGIPCLSELLEWAGGASIDLLVELKDPAAAEAVARMIDDMRPRNQITVGGFHGPALARVKGAVPSIATSLMVGSVVSIDDLITLARAYRADGLHPCWEARAPRPHLLLDVAAVARLHAAKLQVTLWHEEREPELEKLVELGVDAICTNTPDVLRRIIDRRLGVNTAA